jgi:hypothetical protein
VRRRREQRSQETIRIVSADQRGNCLVYGRTYARTGVSAEERCGGQATPSAAVLPKQSNTAEASFVTVR